MNTLIRRAGPEDAANIQRLLAVQLAEHHIDVSGEKLANSSRGALDVPGRGVFLVVLRDSVGVVGGPGTLNPPAAGPGGA